MSVHKIYSAARGLCNIINSETPCSILHRALEVGILLFHAGDTGLASAEVQPFPGGWAVVAGV